MNRVWGGTEAEQKLVSDWRAIWKGGSVSSDVAAILSEGCVFHFQDEEIVGREEFSEFVEKALASVRGLDLVPVEIISHGNRSLLYYYWTAESWEESTIGASGRSNLCQIVFRAEEGRMAEVWQQAADYVFLLGGRTPCKVMSYPQVVEDFKFVRTEQGLVASSDDETEQMRRLYDGMNACALGQRPIQEVSEFLHADATFNFGDKKGEGLNAWKTFAYAIRTAFGGRAPDTVDRVYVNEGAGSLTAFSRLTFDPDSPAVLGGANGIAGTLKIEVDGGKIRAVHTRPENYVSFLGTDFTKHPDRIKELFHGQRKPLAVGEGSPAGVAPKSVGSEVAIVGMAGRFPGAESPEEFWDVLKSMEPMFSEFPEERSFLGEGTKIHSAGLLDHVDEFDASFFNIPPVSAEYMDPQQRILMEVIWQSMEDSAHAASEFSGPRTGLVIAGGSDDYKKLLQESGVPLGSQFWVGNETAIFPAKIARFFDIQGECKAVHAECAGSLFAIHEAMRLIRSGGHDHVIVAGASLFMHSYGFAVREDGLLSTEPRPCLFGRESSGQLRGEAAVAVVLKSLDRAIEDKDEIHGVLAGSAVNNSGNTLSISSPSVERQGDVIADAWRDASVSPSEVSVIECHASGVREGDFAEIAAIKRAFKEAGEVKCSLTSLKGAVGHAEAASGLSVLVKVLLQLRHKTIIGTAGVDEVDPALPIDRDRFDLLRASRSWEGCKVAGINAFAGGGYNAHVVVKESPESDARSQRETGEVLIPLSAATEESLAALVALVRVYLAARPGVDLLDLAFTLQTGRDPLRVRVAFVDSNATGLIERMTSFGIGDEQIEGVYSGRVAGRRSESAKQPVLETDLGKLAEQWCAGETVQWALLYEGVDVRRMGGLPNYPFSRQRFGLPPRESEALDSDRVIMASREWRVKDLDRSGNDPTLGQHRVIFCGDQNRGWDSAQLEPMLDGAACMDIGLGYGSEPEQRFLAGAKGLFVELQRLCKEGSKGQCLIQLVGLDESSRLIVSALSALLRTVQLEAPSIIGQVIELGQDTSLGECAMRLLENKRAPSEDREIRYRGGHREVQALGEIPAVAKRPEVPWKRGGVYLVTGGCGQLGTVFAKAILNRMTEVTLVLTDLAQPGVEQRRELSVFEEKGARIEYRQTDICNRAAVEKLITQIYDEFGSLSGVIHMAGVNRDKSILTKTLDEFESVLAPKVLGAVYLDEATRDRELDFIVLFSSVAVLGNPGQTDYATANSFLNVYADHRNAQLRFAGRRASTLAISWPLWRDGGMQIDALKLKAMEEHTGLVPIGSETGISAFCQALAMEGRSECIVFEGDLKKVRACFFDSTQGVDEQAKVDGSMAAEPGPVMMSPAWNMVELESATTTPGTDDRVVVFGGTGSQVSAIQKNYPRASAREIDAGGTVEQMGESLEGVDHIVWIAPGCFLEEPGSESVIESQSLGTIHLFRIVKALLRLGAGERRVGWTMITEQAIACRIGDRVQATHAGVHGLVGAIAKEYPQWDIRLLDMELNSEWPIGEIFTIPPSARGDSLARRGNEWFRQSLIPVRDLPASGGVYRSQGVYVVIGGAGGLGEIWSRWMIENYGAKIAWIGRRAEDAGIRAKIDALGSIGSAPIYIQADASDLQSLLAAHEKIKEIHPEIHGVVHSAVGLFDQSLAKMGEEEFRQILSVKIDVSVRTVQVFAKEPLDFVLFFSSLASFSRGGGMGGYSAGCTFKDAYARQLAASLPCAVKVMNWGYWNAGSGEAIPENMKVRLARQGMGAIEPEGGMRALHSLLNGRPDQVGLANVLRPGVITELDESEEVLVYPESVPPRPDVAKFHSAQLEARGLELVAEGAHEIEGMEELALQILLGQLGLAGRLQDREGVGFYQRWFDESVAFLERGGLFEHGRAAVVDMPSVWREWETAKKSWNQDASKRATVALVEVCLRALPEILSGERPATSVLFPDSSMALVEGIYKDNAVSDFFNAVLADAVVAYVRERIGQDPRAEIRILEIGAGTGGSTASILPMLEPYQSNIREYCYSDISNSFLFHAESNFVPEYPFVTTALFDVDKPLSSQPQIANGGYDLAIATNVLHATRSIRRTLRNAKAALRTHGLLLLNEVSRKGLFAHLTFGLLEGWWLNEDDALRIPGSPGLTPEAWQRVLEDEGISPVGFPVRACHELGQQIVIATSDGVIRQERPEQVSSTQVPTKQARRAVDLPDGLLREKCTEYFRGLFAKTLRMDAAKIDPAEALEDYGIDSILIVQITNAVREVLEDVTSAMFFEFQTIDAVVEHFLETQRDALVELFDLEGEAADRTSTEGTGESEKKPGRVSGTDRANGPIAIIGMSGRYPQANNLESFWENLKQGKNCTGEIPVQRWPIEGFYHPDPREAVSQGKSCSKWGGFLDGVDLFDPFFFNMTPKEAASVDPQERLFLMEAWKAMEDAGYAPSRFTTEQRRRAGVFAGITRKDYTLHTSESEGRLASTSFASLVNRVSYCMDLQGPSVAVDTMCSSSLVAIHEACDFIRSGKGDLAIAGGVHLYLHPASYVLLSASQFLSSDGRTPAFEEGGSGFVPGEGVGALVLKPLDLALRDRDSIRAVIRGSAVNHCGKTNAFGIPSSGRQADAIREALEQGEIDPRTISYIESAANGAEQGDAIEMRSLTTAFGDRASAESVGRIGSIKPSIGHGESVSGVAQLSKVVLALQHQTLPPTLVGENLNPEIQFDRLRFDLQHEVSRWDRPVVDDEEAPLRAGVTSVGAGGVNTHVILEEFIGAPREVVGVDQSPHPILFVISAKSDDRLLEYVGTWHQFLASGLDVDLPRLAYTLQIGREEMRQRVAFVCSTSVELIERMRRWCNGDRASSSCFWGDAKASLTRSESAEIDTAVAGKDLGAVAMHWVRGNAIPWKGLYPDGVPERMNGLPTYPFAKQSCWIRPLDESAPKSENEENTVAFYSILADAGSLDEDEYLTFCPFPKRVAGFSMTRVALNPEGNPGEATLVRERQTELRQVLFCSENFDRIGSVLDIGCGHGTDVIQLARQFPHLRTDGFTIAPAQADLGNQKIARQNLGSRARIFNKDSAKDSFPGSYDLIIGIEVSFHIEDKRALFDNITSALAEGGRVLLMDYIANLRGPIVDPGVGISIPTQEGWIDLLSEHNLVVSELIDASPQIANYLHDPELEQNIRSLPKVAQDTWRNYANQSGALAKGWISYCLIRLEKAEGLDVQSVRARNERHLRNPRPYPEALEAMLKQEGAGYPASGEMPLPQQQRADVEEIEGVLEAIFLRVLGVEQPELRAAENFQELGIGSVNAVELVEAINQEFDLSLPTSLVFEFNSTDALASHLGQSLSSRKKLPSPEAEAPRGAKQDDAVRREVTRPDDVAIIGISCRCAGAADASELWEVLRDGRDCIQDIEDADWLDFIQAHCPDPAPARYGAMGGTEFFDPLFFTISPKEAKAMDVSQRILLQECYRALEDSGHAPSSLRGKPVGTFIGAVGKRAEGENFSHFSLLGDETSILAARIAYFLDLKGPAIAVDTACSSSLVAIDLACQALKNRSVDLAISGGITVYNGPGAFASMNNAGMLSAGGSCRPFDSDADGVVVGDGVGVLTLKRLEDAERDRDSVYGVIRGSGTNQDGTTSGITVPSFLSQSQLQESVYRRAEIDVDGIQYVAAHGTATKLGDPVEIHALTDSFRKFTERKRFCAVGSLKANIGHATAAAGVMNVIAVLLALKNRQIPPSINFSCENEHIDFEESPFYVSRTLQEWEPNQHDSRMAAVSSFGFSGTNAHMVIEEHAGTAAGGGDTDHQLILLSARDRDRLDELVQNFLSFVTGEVDLNLEELAYTLQVGRDAMGARLGFVADSMSDLKQKLERYLEKGGAVRGMYCGKLKQDGDDRRGFSENESEKAIEKWVGRRKGKRLLKMWINGAEFDWAALHGKRRPRRIHLPGYPFALESFESVQTRTADAAERPLPMNGNGFDETMHSNLLDRYAASEIDFEDAIQLIEGRSE